MRSTSLHAIDAASSEEEKRRSGDTSFLAVTNPRLLPPMHLLRAFVATAHFASVARAAEALHLTPGAVSKQLGELEKWLDAALFDRVRKRLVLTSHGEAYRAALLPALQQLEAATLNAVQSRHGAEALHLGVLPTVRDKWLLPRLPAFCALHPRIELRVTTFSQVDDTPPADTFDAVIRFGRAEDPAWLSDYLVGREVVLIAPPTALQPHPLRAPPDVRHFQLIHHLLWPGGWAQWGALHRVAGLDVDTGVRLMLASSMINAVSTGGSVALMPLFFVHDDIAAGTLSAPFPCDRHDDGGYFLCYPARSAQRIGLGLLRAWLLNAARQTPRVSPAGAS